MLLSSRGTRDLPGNNTNAEHLHSVQTVSSLRSKLQCSCLPEVRGICQAIIQMLNICTQYKQFLRYALNDSVVEHSHFSKQFLRYALNYNVTVFPRHEGSAGQ